MDQHHQTPIDAYEVLLVEDNDSDEELALRALRKSPLKPRVRVARDGYEALSLLEPETDVLPQLILLDLKMPRISGYEVLERVRANPLLKEVVIVALSSSDLIEDVHRCQALGANGYVVKPVDYREYNQALISIVDFWLAPASSDAEPPAASRFTALP